MADAVDRLRSGVTFTSPKGVEFTAKWRGDVRDLDFKIAIFSFPGVVGNVVQNLGANSYLQPLTIFFDTPDHDIVSNRFAETAKNEIGTWQIIHPRYGFRELAPVRMRFHEQSVNNAMITQVDTEWIEPIDPVTLKTAAELSGLIENYADVVDQAAIGQFENNLSFDNLAERLSIENAVGKVQAISDKILGPVAAANNAVFTSFNATQRGIQDILAATVLKPISLAGQIQNLIKTPALAIRDIKSRLSAYAEMAAELFDVQPSGPNGASSEGRNTSAVQELSQTAVVTTNSTITARDPRTGGLRSRAENVETVDFLNAQLNAVHENLEQSQELFKDSPIDLQYFAESQAYTETKRITTLAVDHLLQTSFDLQFEKRFVLSQPRLPAQIVIEETGSLGDNDQSLIDFINYNNLRDTEIILIPAGREVVVYV